MGKEQELRPAACPFCAAALVENGELVRFWKHPVRSLEEAKCPGSHVSIEFRPEPDYEALARWNRRSSSDEQAEVVGLPAIERYSQFVDGWGDEVLGLKQHPKGEYVKFDDVAALLASPKAGVTEAELVALAVKAYDDVLDGKLPHLNPLQAVVEVITAALGVGDEGMGEGAIRICPERDAPCPHGSACPYNHDRYHCSRVASRANLPTPPIQGDAK